MKVNTEVRGRWLLVTCAQFIRSSGPHCITRWALFLLVPSFFTLVPSLSFSFAALWVTGPGRVNGRPPAPPDGQRPTPAEPVRPAPRAPRNGAAIKDGADHYRQYPLESRLLNNRRGRYSVPEDRLRTEPQDAVAEPSGSSVGTEDRWYRYRGPLVPVPRTAGTDSEDRWYRY